MAEPIARAARPAVPAQPERWQDLFWEHAPRTRESVVRGQASALPHTDLFGWLVPDNPPSLAAPAARPVQPAAAPFSRSRAEHLAKPLPASSVRKRRIPRTPVGYSARCPHAYREEVARLLEVNASVIGIRGLPSVELPRAPFAARVALWKARPVGIPFVMGN